MPSTWYLGFVLGTKYLVASTCYQVLGTKDLVASTWYQGPGSKYLEYLVLGTMYLVLSMGSLVHGSCCPLMSLDVFECP